MALPVQTDSFAQCHQVALARRVYLGDGGIEDIAAVWNCALLDGCRSAAECKKTAVALIRERTEPEAP